MDNPDLLTQRFALRKQPGVPKPTIKEQEFRTKWLPLFLDWFSGKDVDIRDWPAKVAGSYHLAVDVVDNASSKVLFTVPSLLQQRSAHYSKEVMEQLPTIIKTAKLHNDAIPGSGDKYLTKNLTEVLPKVPDSTEEEQWKVIYRYYNIDAPFLHTGSDSSKVRETIDVGLIEGYDDEL